VRRGGSSSNKPGTDLGTYIGIEQRIDGSVLFVQAEFGRPVYQPVAVEGVGHLATILSSSCREMGTAGMQWQGSTY